MTKTATKAENILPESVVEFPSFDTSKANDQFRAFAEKGVAQSKEAYERLKTSAEDAQKALESTYESTRAATSELSLKAIAALRDNAETTFSHLESLVGAKSFSELVELQTAFLRKGVEQTLAQAKDLQETASRTATELAKPGKDAFEKFVKQAKLG